MKNIATRRAVAFLGLIAKIPTDAELSINPALEDVDYTLDDAIVEARSIINLIRKENENED